MTSAVTPPSTAIVVSGAFGVSAEVVAMTETEVRAVATVPAELAYLRGHMPGLPVVPGMLIVDLVHRVARRCTTVASPLYELVLAQFSQPLMPGETLVLSCSIATGSREVDAHGTVGERDLCRIKLRYEATGDTEC